MKIDSSTAWKKFKSLPALIKMASVSAFLAVFAILLTVVSIGFESRRELSIQFLLAVMFFIGATNLLSIFSGFTSGHFLLFPGSRFGSPIEKVEGRGSKFWVNVFLNMVFVVVTSLVLSRYDILL